MPRNDDDRRRCRRERASIGPLPPLQRGMGRLRSADPREAGTPSSALSPRGAGRGRFRRDPRSVRPSSTAFATGGATGH